MKNLKDLIEGAYYQIESAAASGKVLRAANPGKNCKITDNKYWADQKFAFVLAQTENGKPWYHLCSRSSAILLQRNNDKVTTRSVSAYGDAAEKWILEQVDVSNGTFCIKYANDQTLALTVSQSGDEVQVEKYEEGNTRHHWKLSNSRYDLTYNIQNIKYGKIDTAKLKKDVVYSKSLSTKAGPEVKQTFTMKKAERNVFTWNFTETLTVGASAKFSANVPFLGSSEVTVSTEFQLSAGQTTTEEERVEYSDSYTVTIPEGKAMNLKASGALDWNINSAIPFEMDVKVTGEIDDASMGRFDARRPMQADDIKKILSSLGDCTAKIEEKPVEKQKYLIATLAGKTTGDFVVDTEMHVDVLD